MAIIQGPEREEGITGLCEESKRQTVRRVGCQRGNAVCSTFGSRTGGRNGLQARAQGEISVSTGRARPPYRSLKNIEEVCDFLEETINRLRQGLLDPRVANAMSLQEGILLKALAQRVESPEKTDSGPGIYQSLFQRLGLGLPQQEEAYPLFPKLPQKDAGVAPGPLPPPAESLYKPALPATPVPAKGERRVITIEVE
jgi:hypothetical protein